jgi:hypothetical protein
LCCFIVGMQVLVGVPLIVCLSFYMLTGGGPASVAFEAHPYPATLPPPVYTDPVLPTPLPRTPLDAPAQAAILESRERLGSPLDDSLLEPVAPQPAESNFSTALQTVSHFDPPKPPAALTVEEELREHAEKLGALATQLEERGQFHRAATIRELSEAIQHEDTKSTKEDDSPSCP